MKEFTEFTPENYQERAAVFQEELTALLKKYHLGLGSMPTLTPDGRIGSVARLQEAVDPLPDPLK